MTRFRDTIANALRIQQDDREREDAHRRAYLENRPGRALEESARREAERIAATELPSNTAAEQWRRDRGAFDSADEREQKARAALAAENARAAEVRDAFAAYDAQVSEVQTIADVAEHHVVEAIRKGDMAAAVEWKTRAIAARAVVDDITAERSRRYPGSFPVKLALAGRV